MINSKGTFSIIIVFLVLVAATFGLTSCESTNNSTSRKAYETDSPYPIMHMAMDYGRNINNQLSFEGPTTTRDQVDEYNEIIGELKLNEDGTGYVDVVNQDTIPLYVNFTWEKHDKHHIELSFEDVKWRTYFVIGPQNPYEATINFKYPINYYDHNANIVQEQFYTNIDTVDITQGVNGDQYHVLWKYERSMSDYSGLYRYGDDGKVANPSIMVNENIDPTDGGDLGTSIRLKLY